MPLILNRRRTDGGRERATNLTLYDILHNRPNPRQTAFEFIEMLQGHLVLRGNAYAEIVPDESGFVGSLMPIHPDNVEVVEVAGQFELDYRIRQRTGPPRVLPAERIFHVRGLSLDGLRGLSVVDYARESIGEGLAAQDYAARWYAQDGTPGGVLKHPGVLSEGGRKGLTDSWAAQHSGSEGWHRPAILEEGMEWQSIGMSHRDAEFLAGRQYNIEDYVRWFRIPGHMLGIRNAQPRANMEQEALEFVTFTMLSWARRWEQAISRALIFSRDLYPEFLFDNLLRGDLLSRYQAYGIGIDKGFLSRDEVRSRENMNAIPGGGGSAFERPLNMEQIARHDGAAPVADGGERLGRLADAAARRIARKETAAMRAAARRLADDPSGWADAVREFYAGHADYVRETLGIGGEPARVYCERQCDDLLFAGAAGLESWEQRAVTRLAVIGNGANDAD